MKIVALLMLAVIACTACRRQLVARVETRTFHPESTSPTATPTPLIANANANQDESEVIPPGFTHVDFKNFSYQTNLRGNVKLKDGSRAIEQGIGGDTFELRGVDYADINGGTNEAVVHLLATSCGGSCDGGSHLFYFFSSQRGRIKLLTRIETGSIAYDWCGLKSFVLKGRELELELFRICRPSGVTFRTMYDADYHGGKFEAHKFTRFRFEFDSSRFVPKKREVLPFSPGDVTNYEEVVR